MKLITNNTYDELVRAAEAARDKIPEAHNRKRWHTYHTNLRTAVHRTVGQLIEPEELQADDILVYARTTNYGTRKYPDYERTVEWHRLTQEDLETRRTRSGFVWRGAYKGAGSRIYDSEVLAVVR